MLRSSLVWLFATAAARAQQLYTVHYRTVSAADLPANLGPREKALLHAPLSVQFAGTTRAASWKPLASTSGKGIALDGKRHTEEFFLAAPIGRLQTIAFRAGGPVPGSAPNATFDVLRDVGVDVGDKLKLKFARHTTQGNTWLYHHANVHADTSVDVEDRLIQKISVVAASGSLMLALLVSLCVQLRGGGGGGGSGKVGAERPSIGMSERVPMVLDAVGGPAYGGGGGLGATQHAPTLPPMGVMSPHVYGGGDAQGAGLGAGVGPAVAGARGYTGVSGGAGNGYDSDLATAAASEAKRSDCSVPRCLWSYPIHTPFVRSMCESPSSTPTASM